jgi:hypothetical protein
MSFGPLQWIAVYFLDILIKATVLTLIGVVVTLGMASALGYISFAILLSVFHFVCLVLAAILMPVFDLLRLRFSDIGYSALFLFIANVLFVVVWAAIFGLGQRPGEIRPGFSDELLTGSCLAITNILPILIVAGCSRLFRGVR